MDSAHGKSIYVSVGSGVTSSYPNIAFLTNSAGTKYVWEGDLYFEDASVSSSRVELVGTEKSSLFSTIGGTLKLYSAGLSQNAGQLESGRWYHFRADIDTDYQTFDFYWDGEQKASKLPLEKDASDLKEIRLFCNFQGNYVLDNVLLKTVVEEPYITGVTYNGKDTPCLLYTSRCV